MIQKHFNKGIIRMAVALGLWVIGIILWASTMGGSFESLGGCLCVILIIISTVIGLFGCCDLLLAKGYDTSMMLAFFIPGLCCSGVFILVAPFVIIYILKDKTRRY